MEGPHHLVGRHAGGGVEVAELINNYTQIMAGTQTAKKLNVNGEGVAS